MSEFKINTIYGIKVVEIISEFTHLGRKYILHHPDVFSYFYANQLYAVSDYLTGRRFYDNWTNKRTAIKECKAKLDENKAKLDKMFKKYKVINP